jgi:hypothetical protein
MTTQTIELLTKEEKSLLDMALTDIYYSTVKHNSETSPIHMQYESLMKKLKGLL